MFFAVALWLLAPLGGRAHAQAPLFTFVQISDSQPNDAADQAAFEAVLDTIVLGGQPGALLPRPVELVLFAGDLVDHATVPEWMNWLTTMDLRLTANGIPYRAVPGNHEQDDPGGIGLYEQFIGDSGVWDFSSSTMGNNGISWSTDWAGLRVIGFNNSNGDWNTISAEDLAQINALVATAQDDEENVLLLCHHPHNGEAVVPLQATLENLNIVGLMRGHSGSPHASQGLSGIANPNVWDLNTNAIYQDEALIYYEVFTTHIQAYKIELVDSPAALPAPKTISLVYNLRQLLPTPPVAQFSAAPLVGPAPLSVTFTDLSTGIPTSWMWTFGDGETSTVQNPTHVYDTPGTYTVTLDVQNGLGSDSDTIVDYVTAEVPPATVTFAPVADARVKSTSPSNNYGTSDRLRVRDGGPNDDTYESYLKFDLTGIGATPLGSALLRLYVTDGSSDGGTLFGVSNNWTETGITWNNRPPMGGIPLGSAGTVVEGTVVEFDVSGIVTGPGIYSFGLTNDASNNAFYWSREGAVPPQLFIEFDPACEGVQCPPGQGCSGGNCEPLCGNQVVDVGEQCANCAADVICPPSMECVDGACMPLCGNGVVNPGEDCADCPQDVVCAADEECVGGECEPLCGNGDVDPGENCATCPQDADCAADEECVGGTCEPLCGNGVVNPGENCSTCPQDVQCAPAMECVAGTCQPLCGNGVVNPGENCATCPQDAACGPGMECVSGTCQPLCGNGVVDPGENCSNCPQEVPCAPGMECVSGTCQPLCGNGVANPGETCATCPQDVPCGPGMECVSGTCQPLCGNGVVNPGEDCSTCPQDVFCSPGMECVAGTCQPLCGNGAANPGEDCATCPEDIQCPPATECIDGLCVALCGNGAVNPGETCLKCPEDVQCPPGTGCVDGMCDALCGNGFVDQGEDCTKCPPDVVCPPGTECLAGMCEPLCGNGAPDPGEGCATCPADVTCPPGTQCQDNACVSECPWDLDDNQAVDVTDFLQLLMLWGPSNEDPPDFNADGVVDTVDFLALLGHWGPCP